jgi:hypothetical protein
MRHLRATLVALVGTVSLVVGSAAVASAHSSHTILEFDSMTPVTGAAVGAVNDRGITGGGKAWVISSGVGEVDRDGSVHVTVHGLVIPALGFINPVAAFGATVSCLTPHGVVNLHTGTAPATSSGDATINGTLNLPLPHPCQQPILFVTSPTGAWFAMSNAEEEDEAGD